MARFRSRLRVAQSGDGTTVLLCTAVVTITAASHGYVPTSQPEASELRWIPVIVQGMMQSCANAFVTASGQNIGAVWLNIRGASGVPALDFFQGAVVPRLVRHRYMLRGLTNELQGRRRVETRTIEKEVWRRPRETAGPQASW